MIQHLPDWTTISTMNNPLKGELKFEFDESLIRITESENFLVIFEEFQTSKNIWKCSKFTQNELQISNV
jgi:hypothetical protein